MRRWARAISVLVFVTAVAALGVIPARAQFRTPDQVYAAMREIGEPPVDPSRMDDPDYREQIRRQRHVRYRKKAALLLELCRNYPQDPLMPQWMERRWSLLGWDQDPAGVADEILADIEQVLATFTHPQVVKDAAYARAYYLAAKHQDDPEAMLRFAEGFMARYPGDDRGGRLLEFVAESPAASSGRKIAMYRRIMDEFPASHLAKYAPGAIRQVEELNQPFRLAFEDFTTGTRVSTADMRGQVVVIIFWATSSGRSRSQVPRWNELARKHRDGGVAAIGVSLDLSEELHGHVRLREFLADHSIDWPQFYQGDSYDSAFSKSWGVYEIPIVFLLDKQGRLRDTDALEDLEASVARLLNE